MVWGSCTDPHLCHFMAVKKCVTVEDYHASLLPLFSPRVVLRGCGNINF